MKNATSISTTAGVAAHDEEPLSTGRRAGHPPLARQTGFVRRPAARPVARPPQHSVRQDLAARLTATSSSRVWRPCAPVQLWWGPYPRWAGPAPIARPLPVGWTDNFFGHLACQQVSVFVSHAWAYTHHYDKLAGWLFGSAWAVNGVSFALVDRSVPRANPIHNSPNLEALKRAIFERIAQADVFVVPTGMYSTHSRWIQREIQGANEYRKPILAVDPWGQQRRASVVLRRAHRTTGWRSRSVVGAIWALYWGYR